jgi:hypothetical protein
MGRARHAEEWLAAAEEEEAAAQYTRLNVTPRRRASDGMRVVGCPFHAVRCTQAVGRSGALRAFSHGTAMRSSSNPAHPECNVVQRP